jgi:tetratricopeptide (TPR) repeat protein
MRGAIRTRVVVGLWTLLFCFSVGMAQSRDEETLGRQIEQAGKLREALTHYVAALQAAPEGSDADQRLRRQIISTALGLKPPLAVPEEAERHMARGRAAVTAARDSKDFEDAIAEFKQAVRAAPWMAAGYYNLGVVQDKAGHYSDAIKNLGLYLLAAPTASDAKEVRSLIYEAEYRRDKAKKEAATHQEEEKQQHQAETQQQAAQQEKARARQLIGELPGTWWNSCLNSSGNGWPENPVEVRVNSEVLEWRASDGSKRRFQIWPAADSGFRHLYSYDPDTGFLTFKNEYFKSTFKVVSRDYMIQEETSFEHAWNPRKCDWRRTN